jgi:hypothetical protein
MAAPPRGPEYESPVAATPERSAPEQTPVPGLLALVETERDRFVPDRLLLILTLALTAAFLLTVLISWWVWHTPALVPVDLESVPRA